MNRELGCFQQVAPRTKFRVVGSSIAASREDGAATEGLIVTTGRTNRTVRAPLVTRTTSSASQTDAVSALSIAATETGTALMGRTNTNVGIVP